MVKLGKKILKYGTQCNQNLVIHTELHRLLQTFWFTNS